MTKFRTQRLASLLAVMATLLLTSLSACHKTEGDVDLPTAARNFIYKYFPLDYISSKSELASGDYQVDITDGPTLIFDSEGKWIELRGNGGTLPQMIAFDYFPSPLYDYIESMEQLDGIYAVSRTEQAYEVLLFDTIVNYNVSTGKVTESDK